ncbi:MAG: CoA transferase, partial [Pseudomonadota bacterium]
MSDSGDDIRSGLRSGPLSHLRVIDLTRVRAGPTAVRHFADWGADVIRCESPEGLPDDPLSTVRDNFDFQNLHRNKRSITLNLREADGLGVFYDLIKTADVFIENARPDVKNRLKIDYETLSALNPRLVYASISGFGQSGPYANRAGYDQVAQGMGGFMSVTGEPDGTPMRAGTAIADLCSGYFAAMGIMTALLARDKTGKGQYVCTSLLQAQIAMMDFQASRYLVTGDAPERAGNDHPYLTPMGVYETLDGHINIAVATDAQWRALCGVLGDNDLGRDPRFEAIMGRIENRDACKAAVMSLTRRFSSVTLIDRLNEAGVPAGHIYDMKGVFEDPQVKHLGMAADVAHKELGDIKLVSQPIEMPGEVQEPYQGTPA